MIFFFTLFLMLLAPANVLIFCAVLMLGCPHLAPRLYKPQRFFILWLIWAFYGCISSQYPIPAFMGNLIRGEGWLTWLVIGRLAWHYWATQEDFDSLAWCSLVSMFFIGMLWLLVGYNPLSDINLASFSTLVAVLLWTVRPELAVLALPFIVLSNNRTAIFATVVGIGVYELLGKSLLNSLHRLALIVIAVMLIVPFTPIAQKIKSFNLESVGLGTRANLIMQSSELWKQQPVKGFGLDVISAYLKNSFGVIAPNGKPGQADRTHNIMYDLILQTGWVGYLLALLSFGSAMGFALKHRCERNAVCAALICAWVAFNFINPTGPAAHVLAMIGIFGMVKYE